MDIPNFLLYTSIIGSIMMPNQIRPVEAVVLEKSNEAVPAWVSQVEADRDRVLQNIEVNYQITDRWENSYEVELTINSSSGIANNWSGSITIPSGHQIVENYGILVSEGTNKVNFTGDTWNNTLNTGEQTKAVLIIKGDPSGEIDLDFDNYQAALGTPRISTFTEEERQAWQQASVDNTEEYSNFLEEDEPAIEETDTDYEEPSTAASENYETEEFYEDEESESDYIETNEEAVGGMEQIDETQADLEEDTETSTGTEYQTDLMDDSDTVDYENFGSAGEGGKFNYALALEQNWRFYMANRSGEMGSDNLVEWRTNSTMNDGADVGKDLRGGLFDAGDHIKFSQPMAFAIAFLAWGGVDYKEAYQQSGQLDKLLNAVKWGTDYFLKCHEMSGGQTSKLYVQVGDHTDHYHWVPPEKIDEVTDRPSFAIDPNNPGSDVAAGVASALASASMLFEGIDDAYSQTLLDNAIALFEFADKYRGRYSDSVPAANPFYTSWSGYEDELPLGAMWLYRATGDSSYLTRAEDYFRNGVGHIGTYTYVPDDHSYAALAMLAKESDDPFFKQEFEDWMNFWLSGGNGLKYTSGGLAVRAEWASAPLALGASYLAEWYSDFVEPNAEYSAFAQSQLDYVLGDNPNGFSYLIGFGDKYPLRPHHRGSAGTQAMDDGDDPNDNLLIGALVGGPSSDDNSHQDRRDDWVTNEVAISYNAPLAGTAIQQYDNYGGGGSTLQTSEEETEDADLDDALTPDIESDLNLDSEESDLIEDDSLDIEEEAQSQDLSLSGGVAVAQFENHASGTSYSGEAQNKDWNAVWSSDDMSQFAQITDKEAHSGSKSLQITYPSDRQLNAGARWELNPEKEYYLSYWVKFEDDFKFNGKFADTSGGKLPGLGTGDLCSGGQTCTGTNGFTSRPMWREDGQAVLYLYHMDKPGAYGEDIPLGRSFVPGKWHNVTQRVKVNDAGERNGEVEVWMDGSKVLTRTGVRLTNGEKIDTAFFSTFHGGHGEAWWPSQNTQAYFDDFAVSTNPSDVGL